jgi:hypothetical protein
MKNTVCNPRLEWNYEDETEIAFAVGVAKHTNGNRRHMQLMHTYKKSHMSQ